jgi:hypothetical protein
MATRDIFALVFLWIAVLSWGIWVGGTIYQMAVVVPVFSASPPGSLRPLLTSTDFPSHLVNFFGPRWMSVRALSVFGALICGWHLRAHRPFFVVAALCMTATVVFSLAYIYPLNTALFGEPGSNTEQEIRAMLHVWIIADRARLLVVSIGYLALLRAMNIAFPRSGH